MQIMSLNRVVMRDVLIDSFEEKDRKSGAKTGHIIEYRQLQLEHIEESGRITIHRVSIPWDAYEDVTKLAQKLRGQLVNLDCEVSAGDRGVLKYRLVGFPHLAPAVKAVGEQKSA
jgi:hypothetical protein